MVCVLLLLHSNISPVMERREMMLAVTLPRGATPPQPAVSPHPSVTHSSVLFCFGNTGLDRRFVGVEEYPANVLVTSRFFRLKFYTRAR